MAGARDRPWPALAALTGAVLWAHLAVLTRAPHWQYAQHAHRTQPAPPARTLFVRRLPPEAPPAEAPVARLPPERPAPPPAPPRPRAPVRMVAAPVPAGGHPEPASALPTPRAGQAHAPQVLPPPARWSYDVQIQLHQQRRQAEGTLVWQHDGDHYTARLELSEGFGAGPRVLESAGRISPEGLAPARFSEAGRRTLAAHFDAAAGRVVFSANTPEAALQAGAQDRLSVLVHLAALLSGAPERFPPGATLSVQTIGAREAALWTFTVEGDEVVALPGGAATLRKLVRAPERPYEARLEVWLDPQRGHLPARIRTTLASGEWLDQRLRTAEPP